MFNQQPAQGQNPQVIINNNVYAGGAAAGTSHFDGGLAQLIGWQILGALVTMITFGLAYPWAICKIYGWEAKHTVIDGRRLAFDGTGMQLFGNWIKWLLLTIVTLGIYAFWLNIRLKQWITRHTHFA